MFHDLRTFRRSRDGFSRTHKTSPGVQKVVVISERLWRRRAERRSFRSWGNRCASMARPYVVAGIMPKSFDPLLSGSELWVPRAFTAQQIADHDNHHLNVLARPEAGHFSGTVAVGAERDRAEVGAGLSAR